MWAALLAMLIQAPIIEIPKPTAIRLRYTESRVFIEMSGAIQDPVRVFAPHAREVWINGEKMTCRKYGNYRLVTFPILHNQEACEPY